MSKKHKMMLDDPKKALRVFGNTFVYESEIYLKNIEGVWGIELINENNVVTFHKSKSNTLQESFEIGDKIIDTLLRES